MVSPSIMELGLTILDLSPTNTTGACLDGCLHGKNRACELLFSHAEWTRRDMPLRSTALMM